MTSRVDLEAPLTDPASFTLLQDLSGALVGLVAGAAPAVVSVHSHQSHSSGFAWRSGLIVTADEALADEGDVAVGLPDGRTLPARVAGRDPTTDIALLRIEQANLSSAALSRAKIATGAIAVVVGAEDDGPTAAFGVVSCLGGPWRNMRGGKSMPGSNSPSRCGSAPRADSRWMRAGGRSAWRCLGRDGA